MSSSPMADSTVPTLTKTTSSPASRASRASVESDVLTPPPEDTPARIPNGTPTGPGKRKAPPFAASHSAKKPRPSAAQHHEPGNGDARGEKKPYCHQCRLAVEPENLLRCTKLRKHSKLQPPRACNYVWCERDLVKRYGIDVDAIRAAPRAADGHDDGLPYTFECPCCHEECQNATCRKKKGLEPLGNVVKKAEDSGMTMAEFLRKSDAGEIADTPKTKKKAKKEPKGGDSDSELSDPDAPPKKKAAARKKADAKKPAAKTKAKTAKGKAAKADPKSKAKAAKEAKSKASATKKKPVKKAAEPKKAAPKRKERPEPPRPVIKNVDTRLSFEEAEQRMYLREFVVRFRGILNLPDRSLAPLDDFDHPLPEATVRSVAGGLLDLIIADGGAGHGTSPDAIETLEDLREELRHYADLARFAKIFSEAQDLLGLEMAPEPSNESRERNEAALRSILDLEEGDATPTWATEPPRRGRAAASRIPSAVEVVRMLLGLCEYVTPLDAMRQEMDPGFNSREAEYRREATRLAKAENQRWEAEKKKLLAARVRCTSAASTRANKATYDAKEAEHRAALHGIELVPRTVALRKSMRFAPLGLDAQGRRYYFLTPRLIDEERYRPGPSSWARTLYVFGEGFPWDDSLPTAVERWMRVESAEQLRALAQWGAWALQNKLEEMARQGFWPAEGADKLGLTDEERDKALALREEREQAEREKLDAEEAELNGKPNGQAEGDSSRPPDSKVNGLSKAAFNEMASSEAGPGSDAGSDASTALSSAPSQVEDLLALLDYTPGYDKMSERHALLSSVLEVAQFVQQLETRGY